MISKKIKFLKIENIKTISYLFISYNFLTALLLFDTPALDRGLISFQSIFISLNSYLFLTYSFFETLSAFLNIYSVDHNIIIDGIKNYQTLNYLFILNIISENLNYLFFFVLILIIFVFRFIIIKKIYQKNFLIILILFLTTFLILNFNNIKKNHYAKTVMHRVLKKDFLRNDNLILLFHFNRINNLSQKLTKNKFVFEELKKKNNYFIIISESYPYFKDKNLSNKLVEFIKKDLNLNFRAYEIEYSKQFMTRKAEEFVFCNKWDYDFLKLELKDYVSQKECWINKKNQNFNKIFLHSYTGEFFSREQRYKSFFNKLFFYNDLKKLGIKECPWNDYGSCDYDIIDNLDKFYKKKEKNIVIFLTLNNHTGFIADASDNFKYDCSENFTLSVSDDFCKLFKNQARFNISLNKFLKKIDLNDIVILLGDTPPAMELGRLKYFNELVPIFIIEKNP